MTAGRTTNDAAVSAADTAGERPAAATALAREERTEAAKTIAMPPMCRMSIARGMQSPRQLSVKLRQDRKFCYFIVVMMIVLCKHDAIRQRALQG
jgi:hypothetical protein